MVAGSDALGQRMETIDATHDALLVLAYPLNAGRAKQEAGLELDRSSRGHGKKDGEEDGAATDFSRSG
jgi:hypothetical protein